SRDAHRPRQRVVVRLIAPPAVISLPLDLHLRMVHIQALQHRLVTRALYRRCPSRQLLLNRRVLHRATSARTPPRRFHLPDHSLDGFAYSLEFLRNLNHHLHRGVSSIGVACYLFDGMALPCVQPRSTSFPLRMATTPLRPACSLHSWRYRHLSTIIPEVRDRQEGTLARAV